MKIAAILSTTVLPLDGVYVVKTLTAQERDDMLRGLEGVTHYVGHPDTKSLVEALGAIQAATKLFAGQQPGEVVVCVPIKQGLSTRAVEGFTVHQAIAEFSMLDIKLLTRVA